MNELYVQWILSPENCFKKIRRARELVQSVKCLSCKREDWVRAQNSPGILPQNTPDAGMHLYYLKIHQMVAPAYTISKHTRWWHVPILSQSTPDAGVCLYYLRTHQMLAHAYTICLGQQRHADPPTSTTPLRQFQSMRDYFSKRKNYVELWDGSGAEVLASRPKTWSWVPMTTWQKETPDSCNLFSDLYVCNVTHTQIKKNKWVNVRKLL